VYLIPFKLGFAAGKVIAKLAPATVPVKYVFVLEIVADVNEFVVTTEGLTFNTPLYIKSKTD
jgi:hypothetical protein